VKTVHVIICGKERDDIVENVNAEIVSVGDKFDTAVFSKMPKIKS